MKRAVSIVVEVCTLVLAFLLCSVGPGAMAEESAVDAVADGVVAFYFHGNARCATCKKIESYADEAVHSGFPAALEEGALAWRVINLDEEENTHFIRDFQLVTRSVVLAEYREGKVVRWENLDKVWQLVRAKDRFVDYIQSETREFLGEG